MKINSILLFILPFLLITPSYAQESLISMKITGPATCGPNQTAIINITIQNNSNYTLWDCRISVDKQILSPDYSKYFEFLIDSVNLEGELKPNTTKNASLEIITKSFSNDASFTIPIVASCVFGHCAEGCIPFLSDPYYCIINLEVGASLTTQTQTFQTPIVRIAYYGEEGYSNLGEFLESIGYKFTIINDLKEETLEPYTILILNKDVDDSDLKNIDSFYNSYGSIILLSSAEGIKVQNISKHFGFDISSSILTLPKEFKFEDLPIFEDVDSLSFSKSRIVTGGNIIARALLENTYFIDMQKTIDIDEHSIQLIEANIYENELTIGVTDHYNDQKVIFLKSGTKDMYLFENSKIKDWKIFVGAGGNTTAEITISQEQPIISYVEDKGKIITFGTEDIFKDPYLDLNLSFIKNMLNWLKTDQRNTIIEAYNLLKMSENAQSADNLEYAKKLAEEAFKNVEETYYQGIYPEYFRKVDTRLSNIENMIEEEKVERERNTYRLVQMAVPLSLGLFVLVEIFKDLEKKKKVKEI